MRGYLLATFGTSHCNHLHNTTVIVEKKKKKRPTQSHDHLADVPLLNVLVCGTVAKFEFEIASRACGPRPRAKGVAPVTNQKQTSPRSNSAWPDAQCAYLNLTVQEPRTLVLENVRRHSSVLLIYYLLFPYQDPPRPRTCSITYLFPFAFLLVEIYIK